MARTITAPIKLTKESIASESNPTEPVRKYAPDLSAMVATAAAIESQAKLVSEVRLITRAP
jgi:hypothetical protein